MYDNTGIVIVRFVSFGAIIAWMFTGNFDFILMGILGLCILNDMQIQNMRT